jgi:hypothetical protein
MYFGAFFAASPQKTGLCDKPKVCRVRADQVGGKGGMDAAVSG